MHPGEVPFPYDISEELAGIYREQGRDSAAYQTLWAQMLERRNSLSGHYVQRIRDSLEEVCNRMAFRGYLVHPDGEVVTEYSGRQDFGVKLNLSSYLLPL